MRKDRGRGIGQGEYGELGNDVQVGCRRMLFVEDSPGLGAARSLLSKLLCSLGSAANLLLGSEVAE